MPLGRQPARNKLLATRLFHCPDHLFAEQSVPSKQKVRVVAQHGASVAGQSMGGGRFAEGVDKGLPVSIVPPEQGQGESLFRGLSERPQFRNRRLDRFPPAVRGSQLRNSWGVDLVRHAPAGVIGQPVTVASEDDVVCDQDDAADFNALLRRPASCQLRFDYDKVAPSAKLRIISVGLSISTGRSILYGPSFTVNPQDRWTSHA